MKFVIFTGGVLEKGSAVENAVGSADKIIAADSGADTALACGVFPKTVIGDMDSISNNTKKELQLRGCVFVTSPAEKDEVDTQLAIEYAIKEGATDIALLGGFSTDRIDHVLANISLTFHPTVTIRLVNGNSTCWVAEGPTEVRITGKENDLLSLIPLSKEVTHIKTEGLYYPLLDEPLYFGIPRGISNVFAQKEVMVSFNHGLLLFTHNMNMGNIKQK